MIPSAFSQVPLFYSSLYRTNLDRGIGWTTEQGGNLAKAWVNVILDGRIDQTSHQLYAQIFKIFVELEAGDVSARLHVLRRQKSVPNKW